MCYFNTYTRSDSDVHPALQSRASVNLVPLNPAPRALSTWPFVLAAPIKVLWQTCDLYVALAYRCKGAQWMLVQVCNTQIISIILGEELGTYS